MLCCLLTHSCSCRALDIAVQAKKHVDTVVAYRQKYMQSLGTEERDARFVQLNQQTQVNWQEINDRVQAELQQESSTRPGGSSIRNSGSTNSVGSVDSSVSSGQDDDNML